MKGTTVTNNKIGILSADALEYELSMTALSVPVREEATEPTVYFFDLQPTRVNSTFTQMKKFLLEVAGQLTQDAANGHFHLAVLRVNKPRLLATMRTRENINFARWVLEDVLMTSSLTSRGSVRIEVRIKRGGLMGRIDQIFLSRNYHSEQLWDGTIAYETNPIPALCEAS